MRFDDSLETVLAGDVTTPIGAQSAWRQLVDLIGRGRAPASAAAIDRLRALRADVPPPVRAASARALAFARPPAALVRLFAEDELSIAAPVLGVAQLSSAQWIEMLGEMTPAARSILRHRRDLTQAVRLALESYGPIDFILPQGERAQPVADAEPMIAPDLEMPVAEDAVTEDAVAEDAVAEAAIESIGGAETPVADAVPTLVPDPLATEPAADEAGVAPLLIAAPVPAFEDTVADEAVAGETPELPAAEPIVAAPAAENAEPVSIDWTEVMAARPAAPTAAAPAEAVPLAAPVAALEPVAEVADVASDDVDEPLIDQPSPAMAEPAPADSSFVSFASVALGLPVVVEAMRQAAASEDAATAPVEAPAPVAAAAPAAPAAVVADAEPRGPFQISDIVARIDAFQRQREEAAPVVAEAGTTQADAPPVPEGFRFETDATGLIRWVEGVTRGPMIGLSLDFAAPVTGSHVDGVAAGAFRRRAGFANARLLVEGVSDAAGQWRISGIPVFDRATGRFTGYRGTGRRPRSDESAAPSHAGNSPAADSLRQLVHELRTPTTAISGFAEMIEGQLLGPVPDAYRGYAGTIRDQAAGLLGAIDDLDTAARIESNALELRPESVSLAPMLARIIADLAPLAGIRGTTVRLVPITANDTVRADERATDRLLARLMTALVSAGGQGESLTVRVAAEGAETVAVMLDRPRALAAYAGDALLAIDAESEAEAEGAPLLGTGFALRLARNLSAELGGSLTIGVESLTLRLPAAVSQLMEQASTS